VNDAERADFVPATVALAERFRHLRAEGAGVGFGWMTEDLHPSGACGNALDADAERGRILVEAAATGLIDLLREIDAMRPAFF
jgi:creatinine amidohydrolase